MGKNTSCVCSIPFEELLSLSKLGESWKEKYYVVLPNTEEKKPQNILGTVLFKPMFLLKKERDPKPKHSLYCKRLLLLKHHCFERLFWTLNNNTTISYRQWCFFFAFLFLLLLLNTVERWRKVFTIYQLFFTSFILEINAKKAFCLRLKVQKTLISNFFSF